MRLTALVKRNERPMNGNRALRVGLYFAGFHALLFFVFLATVGALGGEGRLLWALWLPVDFPVSLLVGLGFDYIPMSSEVFKTLRAWWPPIIHGIFGTIWWFVVPFLVMRFREKQRSRD